ncbi:MinD/ParA family ATP-binding protein [Kocuria sabuli]|uniref:MinD/ParA family ATP-binding protein n=1 Tax=Kocuria sabuli TaxID=3071448 RepID=UPI0034D6CF12
MTATIHPDGATSLDTAGDLSQETHTSVPDARRAVINKARVLAEQTGEETRLQIGDPSGARTILVAADGTSRPEPATPAAPVSLADAPAVAQDPGDYTVTSVTAPQINIDNPTTSAPATAPAAGSSSANPFLPESPAPARHTAGEEAPTRRASLHPTADRTEAPAPAQHTPIQPTPVEASPVRREALPSFVDRPEVEAPAQHGWRGLVNSMGLGLRLAPSAGELSQRHDETAVATHWAGPRTIAVLNAKGGAGKTPTVICLAAVFARLSGGGVLAWDNNNSLGSLGWRTFDSGHQASVVDLLERAEHFMTSDARVGDLSGYVHHQPADRYDVLRSDDRSGDQERHMVTGPEVERLHAVAAKYYRAIVMDSGNTERGANWQAMIAHTDQVVLPVKSVDESAEGASRVLAALQAGNDHAQVLARNAVVIVLCAEPSHPKKAKELASRFAPHVRAVAMLPYDRALVEGRVRYSAMAPATRRAWLHAGAAVREGL